MNYSASKSKIKPQITRENAKTVLFEVVQICILKLAKWILKKWSISNLDDCLIHANGADIQALDNYAIIRASRNGHLSVVEFLHANGVDIQAEGNIAIQWTSRNDHLPVVEFLHANGADIQAGNNYAIKWASINGHLPVVRFLHANGADVSAIGNCHAIVAAYIAAKK